ncbi:FecR family protein [Algoriphagus halophytocola]|uniref:FecR domain-containing protein n=1 Tax=Algoriphagus halophytocola TaxID=2991499 RepID=A0ABY6MND0_9BACT|nr:FecR domain-containing protein [Algoriphagus sp. TR-M5]UZD23902.1 FecR domain-containing protein [Algoriphagus sp. TR-M5]
MEYQNKIDAFYKGELSQQEAEEFLEFLESKEAEEYFSGDLIQIWISRLKDEEYKWDSQKVWERIKASKLKDAEPYFAENTRTKKLWNANWIRAAVVVFILGLTSVFYFQTQKVESPQTPAVAEVELITNSNPKGQKTKVMLEDGSQVYLNSQSSITYAKDFKTNRYIRLEGEAFFEVAEDKEHPFEVEANGIVTTALGTSFNITTFQKDEQVAVTLLTGKVKLQQQGKNEYLELHPGEESLLSQNKSKMHKYKVSAQDRILWTKGILKFEEASFGEMVEVLERWYAVDIQVSGNPNSLKASGVFDNQESLRNVLNVMSETLEFDFEIEDQVITIKYN